MFQQIVLLDGFLVQLGCKHLEFSIVDLFEEHLENVPDPGFQLLPFGALWVVSRYVLQ